MKIERGVPVPTDGNIGPKKKYPFPDMQIGDSIFFEGETTSSKMQARAHQFGSQVGWRFVSRTQEGGLRIWRVA